jgi:multidrug resistance efflux pump
MQLLRLYLQVAAAGLLLCGLVACAQSGNAENTDAGRKTASGIQKKAGAKPAPDEVVSTPPRTTTQPARVEAFETTPLYAKISGYVLTVHKDIGDRIAVKEIEKPLVTLFVPEMFDEEKQKIALETQAKAQVDQSKAAVTVARARLTSAKSQVEEANAGLDKADGTFKRWKSELARLTSLAKDGSVTQKLVDEARFQFDSSEAARKEALAKIRSAKAAETDAAAAIEQTLADERTAAAKQKVAAANRGYTQTMLKYAVIHAPFPGVITERNVDTGHFVRPGDSEKSRPLFVIAKTDTVRVFVDVPEREAPFIARGNKAVVRVKSLGKQGEFTAAVTRTSYALNPRNRTLRVEIDIPNSTGWLRPGMYATATISLSGLAVAE